MVRVVYKVDQGTITGDVLVDTVSYHPTVTLSGFQVSGTSVVLPKRIAFENILQAL